MNSARHHTILYHKHCSVSYYRFADIGLQYNARYYTARRRFWIRGVWEQKAFEKYSTSLHSYMNVCLLAHVLPSTMHSSLCFCLFRTISSWAQASNARDLKSTSITLKGFVTVKLKLNALWTEWDLMFFLVERDKSSFLRDVRKFCWIKTKESELTFYDLSFLLQYFICHTYANANCWMNKHAWEISISEKQRQIKQRTADRRAPTSLPNNINDY